jgi:membrane protease YdiL (CAAX protease family)
MNFLTNASKGNNSFRSYIVSLFLVFIGYAIIGQIPLLVDVYIHQKGEVISQGFEYRDLEILVGKNLVLTYLILPFVAALIAIIVAVKYVHKRSALSVFTGRKSFDWKRFLISFILWGLILTSFLVVSISNTNQIVWNLDPTTFIPLVLISLLLIPLQTTCEEVLFRGYLFQVVGHVWRKGWLAVLFSGFVFGLMHAANPEVAVLGKSVMIYYIFTGLFLGIMTLMDNGLELSMGYHAVNNIFAALILTNNWQAFRTDALFVDLSKPQFGWDSILTIVLVQPLILVLFSKLFGWKNWRSTLFSK